MRSSSLRAAATSARPLERNEIHVGKDILELVSSAMYVDPMIIYREYIQNAADAIDAARNCGLLSLGESGRVEIDVDPVVRSIRIRDNGIGLNRDEFLARMASLGGSSKRGAGARGFRGVGRLSGLGYAQQLIFRSRAAGQPNVCELIWDCRRLKAALMDSTFSGDVADLVSAIVTISDLDPSSYPDHFFEVELAKVMRVRSDKISDVAAIEAYLCQVAPVPFADTFSHGGEIVAGLKALGGLTELEITVNGRAPLRRPHRDVINLTDTKFSDVEGVEIVSVKGSDGGLAATGWFLHHDYTGALPLSTLVKGVRLRVGNLQVGDHTVIDEMFAEPRFNAWAIGEVHVSDSRIVPNGRRDQFEPNVHLTNLVNQLSPIGRNIATRCRVNSQRRSKRRDFDLAAERVRNSLSVLKKGTWSSLTRRKIERDIKGDLDRMQKICDNERLFEPTTLNALRASLQRLRNAVSGITRQNMKSRGTLDRLPAKERRLLEKVFAAIYEGAGNKAAARSLIDRIISGLDVGP